ncbi:MAG: DUF1189 family protein [Verrucomicrobiota bacterium]
MNKKYSMLHLPVLSFFSKRLYRDVGYNWKGANMAYLFLLLAVCWIPPTLSLQDEIAQSLSNNQMKIINQLPDIHIKNGQVKVEQENPLHIKKSNGTIAAIIDTTGSMNYIDDDNVMALLTGSDLIVRIGRNQFNTLSLASVSDFHLNKEIASKWIQMTQKSLAPLSYGIFLFLSYIFIILLMLLIATAGSALSFLLHGFLGFSGVLRITVAAATPPIILLAASTALKHPIPGLVYAILALLYPLFAIISSTRPDEKTIPKLRLTDTLDEEEQASHQSNAA